MLPAETNTVAKGNERKNEEIDKNEPRQFEKGDEFSKIHP